MRVLILEDNHNLAYGLKSALVHSGCSVEVLHDDKQEAGILKYKNYDLLLLDLGVPGLNGTGLLRRLRQHNKTLPVLIISARDQLDQRIEGVDLAADDYLCKPFDLNEVVARAKELILKKSRLCLKAC